MIGAAKMRKGETMKALLMLVGIVVLAAGLFFMGQGAGLIRRPAESFMISATQWIYYGGGIAVAGILLIVIARLSRIGRIQ
ncbi:MAG: hypothetical protein ABSE67_19410 [Xanthobacteraceae bacterium]|jgi:hypothetical protein